MWFICFGKRCCFRFVVIYSYEIFDVDEFEGLLDYYIFVVSLYLIWGVVFKLFYVEKWFVGMVLKLYVFFVIYG